MNIKSIVKGNTVRFLRYRQGVIYYGVRVPDAAEERTVPVPLDDIGDATLESQDKAAFVMRYIRKAIANGSFVPFCDQADLRDRQ